MWQDCQPFALAAFTPQEKPLVLKLSPISTKVYGSRGSFSYLQILRWNFGPYLELHSNLINYGLNFSF
jgi:hypothetical protein